MDHIQKNMHPGHLERHLEAQAHRLRKLTSSLAEADASDPAALKAALVLVVDELSVSNKVVAALVYRATRG